MDQLTEDLDATTHDSQTHYDHSTSPASPKRKFSELMDDDFFESFTQIPQSAPQKHLKFEAAEPI